MGKKRKKYKVPIKSWCSNLEGLAMKQAEDLAMHPVVFYHVSLMPDCHPGYGMPIGGVIAADNAAIPNAVGVDIGCGMGSVRTNLPVSETSRNSLREVRWLHWSKNMFRVGKETPIKSHRHGKTLII
jgi:tRNA-splicing ligase RtcB